MPKMSFILDLLLFLSLINIVYNDVNITDSGVIPWKEGDFAITFYVTLNNFGNRPVTVVADMIKCCELITDTDVDCNHFQLIGSNIYLEAQRARNITLPYLNLYAYNRRGECEINVEILFNSIGRLKSTFVQHIHFDTSIIQQKLPSSLRGRSKIKCEFPDEDPLDSCLPVNCHMKYSGYRGFYSTSVNKCVEIPMCQSTYDIDQAYLWSENQCVDLNNTVKEEDFGEEILNETQNDKSDEPSQTVDNILPSQKVRCHHGHLNKVTDICDCDVGWESEKNMDWDDFIPSTIPIQMCTVRVQNSVRFIEKLENVIGLEHCTLREFMFSMLFSCVCMLFIALVLRNIFICLF